MDKFDVRRAELLLRDLEKLTHAQMPMLRFERVRADVSPVQAVANRIGLFRLGIRLAAAALYARDQVRIDEEGWVTEDSATGNGLLRITFCDEYLSRPRPVRNFATLGCILVAVVTVVIMLALVGLGAVVQRLDSLWRR